MGFGQGLSGLRAASQNLDVIGNNIANSGTVGFKSGSVSFADVYASSRVGLGVKVAGINQRFTVGTVTTTGGEYDIAIDGAKGFFRLADTSGNIVYSRNGEFGIDKDFFITNALGYRLTGYPAGGVGTDPVALSVPQGNIAPQVSSTASTQTNLNANAEVVPAAPAFDPTNSATYTDSVPTTIYDSLGNAHQLVQYFVKRAASPTGESQYDVYYTVDGKAMTVDGGQDHTTLTFNSAGVLTGASPDRTIDIPNPGGTTSPADNMTILMSYQNVTQFGSDFSPKVTANGYASGEFSGISIAKDGTIVAQYTNGESQSVGTIALANFNNVGGLKPVGDNAWAETSESGQATLGQPGSNGLATLVGQALEASNVDMSQELVNMIVAQRTYQANAQTIKTQDEVLQVLMNMR
ncbi:flagellar hook protein FlgE [Bordetella pseudohinzii]|uniref:Flagellar hook protein FlgE n=1 Tax=Bordetella pseudohinzii TaxID=1331258 RepID=A0A0J6BZE3_9BORD|nr:flagellar hook protein FlgE [Bordetella pseudohinzii]ANY15982.1 flagellar biosynthesis protein FlgE [Bordetella pseudohinzii]KMM23881.1 flagellar hook protein FlgE [Bordetella pseudohinzii]KXA75211.1 flagellar biosynthesis protein FlgE [Bordetella pseudohinzii]KXA75337.1 flagellar biosynthesis protein FlgE [Bordetella pseudohinzii]CUJ19444.1 Flagellar hook protein flgE [Bordetella pseudohinzii]